MKYIKIYEKIKPRTKFINLIYKIYGIGGIFSKYFKKELTRDIIEKYVDTYMAKRGENFNCDDVERMFFRDYLLVKLGYDTLEDCESKDKIKDLFTQEELNDAEVAYNSKKFNL